MEKRKKIKPKQKAKITDSHRIKTVKERSTYTFTEPLTHVQQNPIKQQRGNERGKKKGVKQWSFCLNAD